MKYFLATLIIMITLPLVAQAEVRINEIAWMGVSATNGQYGEWFELYNSGSESVSLSGWKLYKGGGTKLIYTFSGTVASGAYYVVERTTASILDPVPGVQNESGAFSNSGFANTGEFLVLKDAQGQVVESLDYASGWPAGDAASKNTMQYSGSWITATPTPGNTNSSTPVVNTPETPSNEQEEQEDTPLYTTEKGSETGIRTKESRQEVLPLLVRAKKDPHIDFTFPSTVYTGNIYDFWGTVTLEYNTPTNGVFVWNMGDGEIIRRTENTVVSHVYRYKGTYTVTLSYYPTERYGTPVLWARRKVVVVEPQITIRALDNETIEITNHADTAVDLSNWVIHTETGSGAIPTMTILAAKSSTALSTKNLFLGSVANATLSTMNGTVVASVNSNQQSLVQQGIIGSIKRVLSSSKNASQSADLEPVTDDKDIVLPEEVPVKQNHTKNIVIGVIVVVIFGALLFIERIIAHQD